LFWCGRPNWLLRFIQLLLLLTSSFLGIAVYFAYSWSQEGEDDLAAPPMALYAIPFIPPVLTFAVLLPALLILLVKIMVRTTSTRRDCSTLYGRLTVG